VEKRYETELEGFAGLAESRKRSVKHSLPRRLPQASSPLEACLSSAEQNNGQRYHDPPLCCPSAIAAITPAAIPKTKRRVSEELEDARELLNGRALDLTATTFGVIATRRRPNAGSYEAA
jgi:hypothetical protein